MAYTAPTTHVAGETLPAADYNVIVNDIIDHETRITNRGLVASSTSSAQVSVNTTETDYLSVTFTASSAVTYEISAYVPTILKQTNAGVITMKITNSSNVVQELGRNVMLANDERPLYMSVILTGLSGSVTYKLRHLSDTTGGVYCRNDISQGVGTQLKVVALG